MRNATRATAVQILCLSAAAALLSISAAGQHGTAATTTSPVAAGSRPAVTRPAPTPRSIGTSAHSTHRAHGSAATGRPNILGPDSSAPRPTWELPKNTTPHWETPSYNNVQPNQVQGNARVHSRQAYGVGGVGYVGVSLYPEGQNYVDAGSVDDSSQAEQGQAQQAEQRRPDYVPASQQQEDWGPAGPPPDVAARQTQEHPRQMTAAEAAAAQSNGLDHPEVTLVFNDGRRPKKIRSYALTSTSVFVSENGHQTQIPVADLDLAATIAQNREAGVEFALPQSGR